MHPAPLLASPTAGFSGGSNSKESACNAGDPGSIPRLRRSPGEEKSYLLQYSCLRNSMDRGDINKALPTAGTDHWFSTRDGSCSEVHL